MTAKPFRFTKSFVEEACDFCGDCFAKCPVLKLPLPEAQAEIKRLIASGTSPVLDRCTGCMACNTICPRDANPHTLIVSAWGKRYREQGLPERARLALPYQERNIHRTAQRVLPQEEQALVRQWEANWKNPPGNEVMMYAGCNMLLLPFLLDSPLYDDLPIFGSLDICCGEPLYRMGCWDAARDAAANVRREFERMGLKKIVVPCLACYHLFTYVYPQILEVALDVEVISLESWLQEQINQGKIKITPLNETVVLHDNCWPKASGDAVFGEVRTLLATLGVTVNEPEHARENALCCGMCAAASRYRLRDVVRTAKTLLQELENTPGDTVVEYCGGCTWLLSLVNQALLSRYRKPRYHILELVQRAAGETSKHRTDQRMRSIMYEMGPELLASYAHRERFWIRDIFSASKQPSVDA